LLDTRAFIYVVDRDFGFAPNPFHGFCTLATCKPRIRSVARPSDWIIGVGGSRLKATNRCIFAMQVSERISFNDYWENPEFSDKKPVRNGSARMLVGDNIYRYMNSRWEQADSHHSLSDGSQNLINLRKDTSSNSVLISRHFFYFGKSAVEIPGDILEDMGYANARNHRTFKLSEARRLIEFINKYPKNQVLDDPFDFHIAASRYAGVGSKVESNFNSDGTIL
jgi:hypothetical protein